MAVYIAHTKIYDERIAPYLKKIIIDKKIDEGKYDFAIEVKGQGRIDCCPLDELEEVIIYATSCSEEINNKLKELTKFNLK